MSIYSVMESWIYLKKKRTEIDKCKHRAIDKINKEYQDELTSWSNEWSIIDGERRRLARACHHGKTFHRSHVVCGDGERNYVENSYFCYFCHTQVEKHLGEINLMCERTQESHP